MDKIDNFLSENPRFKRFQKPLEAARVCDAAAAVIGTHAKVVSFKLKVLTVAVSSAAARYRLQSDLENFRALINQKLGQESIEKIRVKIIPD